MSYSWVLVVAATVGIYYLAEWMARLRRDRWPYLWIRLFRREEYVICSPEARRVLHELLTDDADVRAVGLEVKVISQDAYVLSIPMLPHMKWRGNVVCSLVNGYLHFEQTGCTLMLKAGVPPGHSAALIAWPLTLALMAISARKPGSSFLFLILFYSLGWGAFRLLMKPRLEDFWFLVTSKLATLDSDERRNEQADN